MSDRLELNDELLRAYVNGELDAEMRARVDQALVDDTGARVRLERMRPADQRVSGASRSSLPVGLVITALAATVAGVIIGFVLARSQPEPEVTFVAAAPAPLLSGASSNRLLLAALDNGESGKSIEQGGRSTRIILTFAADDGRFCRAFRSHEASVAAEGVACRNGGQWEVVAWDGTVDPDEGFRAAGASELLDDVMDRLGGGAALEAADERALIERHWSVPPQ